MTSTARMDIEKLFAARAGQRYGLEDISQQEHALQAAMLAEAGGASPAFILAALLHDIGHLLPGDNENLAAEGIDDRHETLGANWLAAHLPPEVSEPVRLHVEAKRYLCGTDPAYHARLAPDSVLSLRLQGGPMDHAECAAFLRKPYANDAIRLRLIDDCAKLQDCSTPPLAHFLGLLDRLEPGPVPRAARHDFARQGFAVLRGFFSPEDTTAIRAASEGFGQAAAAILAQAHAAGMSLAEAARIQPGNLIVVPEASNPLLVCRFEYLIGTSPTFAQFAGSRIEPVVSALMGERFIPFKDKENEKHPGGGAFRPHQDFAAYQAFGPRYNVTAMLSVDAQTEANGCLEFATNLDSVASDPSAVDAWVDGRPLLRFHRGGPANGDVLEPVVERLAWQAVTTAPGDLVVFDSFVPHRSAPNTTDAPRRAMFLTYAAAREGDWYARYYADKRANYGDPKFHVSTPTIAASAT